MAQNFMVITLAISNQIALQNPSMFMVYNGIYQQIIKKPLVHKLCMFIGICI